MKLPKAGQMVYVFIRHVHVIRSKRFATYAECDCYVNGKVQALTFYADGTYSNHDDPMDSWLVDKWDWSRKRLQRRMPMVHRSTIRHTFRSSMPRIDNLPKKDAENFRVFKPELKSFHFPANGFSPSSLHQSVGRIKRVESGRTSAAEPQPFTSYPRGVISNSQLCKVWPDGDTTKEPEMRIAQLSPKLLAAIDKMAEKEIHVSVDLKNKEYVYVGTDA
jgi:hypothetical protein